MKEGPTAANHQVEVSTSMRGLGASNAVLCRCMIWFRRAGWCSSGAVGSCMVRLRRTTATLPRRPPVATTSSSAPSTQLPPSRGRRIPLGTAARRCGCLPTLPNFPPRGGTMGRNVVSECCVTCACAHPPPPLPPHPPYYTLVYANWTHGAHKAAKQGEPDAISCGGHLEHRFSAGGT